MELKRLRAGAHHEQPPPLTQPITRLSPVPELAVELWLTADLVGGKPPTVTAKKNHAN